MALHACVFGTTTLEVGPPSGTIFMPVDATSTCNTRREQPFLEWGSYIWLPLRDPKSHILHAKQDQLYGILLVSLRPTAGASQHVRVPRP
jgi:hypothetical protein